MSRTVKCATVQMDVTPVPVSERLQRAARLIAGAVNSGAQLVVLPELFNTGYEFTDRNYALAERLDGETVNWMKAQAAQHGIHLAGTLMLLDTEDIYNAALLFAPDGRMWRYDKQYPFLWERAYFRDNHTITIAETDLGKIGMMICWDSAHPDLWARYAGKVDLMVIPSSPPKMSSGDLIFPDGFRVNMRDLGGLYKGIYADVEYFPGADLDDQAAWLGVPVVHSTGAGTFRSRMPEPFVSLSTFLSARPDLWDRLGQADQVCLEAGFDAQAKIVDGNGIVLSRVGTREDGFTVAEVTLSDSLPQPRQPQPKMRTPLPVYLFADVTGPSILVRAYREGVRAQWGEHMAPIEPRTRVWVMALAAAAAGGWLLGRLGRGEKVSEIRLRIPRSRR